jgi:cytoskeletal protein CcmA (bactofilin family)
MFDKRKDSSTPSAPTPAQSQSNQPPAEALSSRNSAVIGQSITIKGSISGDESLLIDGTIEGSVDLPKNDLTIGQTGQVTANLDARTVRIDGQVHGDIKGKEKVIITKSGRVNGNVIAPRVTLEDGSKFKGRIDMDPGEPVTKPTAFKPTTASSRGSSGKSTEEVKAAG